MSPLGRLSSIVLILVSLYSFGCCGNTQVDKTDGSEDVHSKWTISKWTKSGVVDDNENEVIESEDDGKFNLDKPKQFSKPWDHLLRVLSQYRYNHRDPDEDDTSAESVFMNHERIALRNLLDPEDSRRRDRLHQRAFNSDFAPGQLAQPFKLDTIHGKISYPSALLSNKSLLFHLYDPKSGFVQALWGNKNGSLNAIIENATEHSHYIFIPVSLETGGEIPAEFVARHMRSLFDGVASKYAQKNLQFTSRLEDVMSRIHFVTQYLHNLGNWIPALLMDWRCSDHNCGYDQVNIKIQQTGSDYVSPRLDARYDWLPSPKFKDTVQARYHGDGCVPDPDMKGLLAIVQDDNCTYFKKVSTMQTSGAVGVIVVVNSPDVMLKDMNCAGSECDTPLSIPATMIPYFSFKSYPNATFSIQFQNTPSHNFFFAINPTGQLAEVGWFLYPSFMFLVWQDQWLKFRQELNVKLSVPVTSINVFNKAVMHGSKGAETTVQIPANINQHSKVELDFALSCPSTMDGGCPQWDHTIQLYVCCNTSSPLCGMELGRWITPFRRGIGHWLTNVTALTPLLDGNVCTFTMKTVSWAMPWLVTLNLRVSKEMSPEYPSKVTPLFQPGFTFNEKYNTHWKPFTFNLTKDLSKVEILSVITGHGSDNHQCGEFCATTHVFTVNSQHNYTETFSNAGTPLGCAEQVPLGVVPNEHGTWLYGRDGWCDGLQVSPVIYDITGHLSQTANNITYQGLFDGQTPHPTENPGDIIIYSYLVFYSRR